MAKIFVFFAACLATLQGIAASPVELKVGPSSRLSAPAELLRAIESEVVSEMNTELRTFFKSSFLSTPAHVLASDLKHTLFATQSLRAPVPAEVNVIEKENAQAIKALAKYDALVTKSDFLRRKFYQGLSALRK